MKDKKIIKKIINGTSSTRVASSKLSNKATILPPQAQTPGQAFSFTRASNWTPSGAPNSESRSLRPRAWSGRGDAPHSACSAGRACCCVAATGWIFSRERDFLHSSSVCVSHMPPRPLTRFIAGSTSHPTSRLLLPLHIYFSPRLYPSVIFGNFIPDLEVKMSKRSKSKLLLICIAR